MSLFRSPGVAIVIQAHGLARQLRLPVRRRKREQKCLNGGIGQLDLKGHLDDRSLLPQELIDPRLSKPADAISAGIGYMIVAVVPFRFTLK